MSNDTKITLIFFIIIAGGFACLFRYHIFLVFEKKSQQIKTIITPNKSPDITLEKLNVYHSTKKISVKLKADCSVINRKKNLILCSNATCNLFNQSSQTGTLNSPFIRFDKNNGIISCYKAKGIINSTYITGDNIAYNLNDGTLSSSQTLSITTKNITIEGQQASYDITHQKTIMKGGVKTVIIFDNPQEQ